MQLSFFCSGFLSGEAERLVLDRTNLTGRFDIRLQWTPAGESVANSAGNPTAQPGESGPSIFTAVREQLGLRLEPAKAPVEVLVIDHAEKPTAN